MPIRLLEMTASDDAVQPDFWNSLYSCQQFPLIRIHLSRLSGINEYGSFFGDNRPEQRSMYEIPV